ncbi:MAG: hypothetical protein ACTHU0_33905 [Kofleriaceae bacterium]
MGGTRHTKDEHLEIAPKAAGRGRESPLLVEDGAAATSVAGGDAALAAGPRLGAGRGLPGAGGGHHPGDDDGCVENSFRD